MHRRTTLSLAVVAAASALAFSGPAAAQQTIKIGAVAPKPGPLAGGAAVTQHVAAGRGRQVVGGDDHAAIG